MEFRFKVKQNPLEIEFAAGSIKEGIAILESEQTAVGEFFKRANELAGSASPIAITAGTVDGDGVTLSPVAEADAKKRRGRRSAQDPATAQAPAPAAVPDATPPAPPAPPVVPAAAAPAPVLPPAPPAPAPLAPPVVPAAPVADQGQDGLAVPAFLARNPDNTLPGVATIAPAAAVAPPPPPPPAPPAPAPNASLAGAVIKAVRERTAGAADNGKSFVDWMVSSGVRVSKTASLDEAIAVLQFEDATILKALAGALNVAG